MGVLKLPLAGGSLVWTLDPLAVQPPRRVSALVTVRCRLMHHNRGTRADPYGRVRHRPSICTPRIGIRDATLARGRHRSSCLGHADRRSLAGPSGCARRMGRAAAERVGKAEEAPAPSSWTTDPARLGPRTIPEREGLHLVECTSTAPLLLPGPLTVTSATRPCQQVMRGE